MSSATDSGMFKTMGIVMGALAAFAIVIMLAARLLGGDPEIGTDRMLAMAKASRIEPVAGVRTSADELPANSSAAPVEVAGAPRTAQELIDGACAACHASGVAGAPKLDDDAEWAKRREAGLDALVASVINGKGSMPPRGGSTYTDEEIGRAVEQMAGFAVAEAPAAEAPAAETPAAEEAPADSGDSAAAPAAQAGALAIASGAVPAGMSDNVKNTVDGVCIGCHLAGVAGAPKLGDAAAWQPRVDKGMDALVSSVTNGLNAMPPRGGSTLTDEEIPVAIQYLISKQ